MSGRSTCCEYRFSANKLLRTLKSNSIQKRCRIFLPSIFDWMLLIYQPVPVRLSVGLSKWRLPRRSKSISNQTNTVMQVKTKLDFDQASWILWSKRTPTEKLLLSQSGVSMDRKDSKFSSQTCLYTGLELLKYTGEVLKFTALSKLER